MTYGRDGKPCRARNGTCCGCRRRGKLIVMEGPSGVFCGACARELETAWNERRAPRFRARRVSRPASSEPLLF